MRFSTVLPPFVGMKELICSSSSGALGQSIRKWKVMVWVKLKGGKQVENLDILIN